MGPTFYMVVVLFILGISLPYWMMVLGFIYYNPPVYHKEMVCCAYNEDLKWLHKVAPLYDTVYLYIKNEKRVSELEGEFFESNIKIIPFENIGSCDHIYLYHIITHYDTLADEVSFIKGTSSCARQTKYKYIYLPLGQYRLFKDYYSAHPVGKYIHSKKHLLSYYMEDYHFRFNSDVIVPFEKSGYTCMEDFLDKHFTQKQKDLLLDYAVSTIIGGNFIVRKDNIKRYPKELYERLLDTETPGPNRLLDHYQERLWGLMYSNTHPNPLQ